MAEDIKLKIELDGKQAIKTANDFADSMDETSQTTEKASKSINSLESQIESLREEMNDLEIGSKKFNELGKEVQSLESELKNVELQFEALDFEQKLTAGTDAAAGVAGGFAAVEGAIALAGVESEEFEKTMIKVQGAMALAMGVRDIGTAVVALQKLGAASKIASIAQAAFNAVMNANPILLIATAIGLVVTGFIAFSDTIKRAVMPVLEPLIDSFDAVKNGIKSVGEFLGLIPSEAEKAAKAQAEAARIAVQAEIDKQREIANSLEKERAERTKTFDKEIQLRKAAGEDTKEIEKDKLKFIIESLQKENEARQKARELERQQAEEYNNAITKDFADAFKKRIELEEKADKERLEQAKFNLELFEIEEQKAADEAAKNRQKEANDRLKKQQENNQKELDLLKKQKQDLRKLEIENIEDDELREIAKIQNEKELREQAARDTITDAETLAKTLQQIRIKANNDLNEIDAKYREEERIKEEEREQQEAERRKQSEQNTLNILAAAFEEQQKLEDEAEEKRLKRKREDN